MQIEHYCFGRNLIGNWAMPDKDVHYSLNREEPLWSQAMISTNTKKVENLAYGQTL